MFRDFLKEELMTNLEMYSKMVVGMASEIAIRRGNIDSQVVIDDYYKMVMSTKGESK